MLSCLILLLVLLWFLVMFGAVVVDIVIYVVDVDIYVVCFDVVVAVVVAVCGNGAVVV